MKKVFIPPCLIITAVSEHYLFIVQFVFVMVQPESLAFLELKLAF